MINTYRENGQIAMIVPVNVVVSAIMEGYCYESSQDVIKDSTEYNLNDIINTVINGGVNVPVNILLHSVARAYNISTVDQVQDSKLKMTLGDFIQIIQQYGFA